MRSLVLCLSVACTLPAGEALLPPPPTTLAVSASPITPGAQATLTVTGLGAYESVYLVRADATGSGLCPRPLGGLCLDVDRGSAVFLGGTEADDDAVATLTFTVPAGLPLGSDAVFQAAAIRGPNARDSVKSQALVVPVVPDDVDGDGFTAADDCDDLDPTVFPGAPERCNGVDDDCDTVLDPTGAILVQGQFEYPDLATAIASTPPGGRVELCGGTFAASGITFGDDLSIVGAGLVPSVIDGQQGRAFEVPFGVSVSMSDLTVTHLDNDAGILVAAGGTLTLDDMVFEGNLGSAVVGGGGNNGRSTVVVRDSVFRDNEGVAGAGLRLEGAGTVERVSFLDNTSSLYGGGLAVQWPGLVEVVDSTFHRNAAPQGGGIYLSYEASVSCTGCDMGIGATDNTVDDLFVRGSGQTVSVGNYAENTTFECSVTSIATGGVISCSP